MSYTNEEPDYIPNCKPILNNYVITGILKNSKRFMPIITTTPQHYNVWKGSIWVITKDTHKRKLIQRII